MKPRFVIASLTESCAIHKRCLEQIHGAAWVPMVHAHGMAYVIERGNGTSLNGSESDRSIDRHALIKATRSGRCLVRRAWQNKKQAKTNSGHNETLSNRGATQQD